MNSIFRVRKHFTALDLLCSSTMNYRIISRERTPFPRHLDSVVPRNLLYLSLTLCFVTMHSRMLVARCSTSIADLLFMVNTFTLLRSDCVNSTGRWERSSANSDVELTWFAFPQPHTPGDVFSMRLSKWSFQLIGSSSHWENRNRNDC